MRDPIETGRSAHPKAEVTQRPGKYPALPTRERAVVIDGLQESRIVRRANVDRVIDLPLGKCKGEPNVHAGLPANDVKQAARWPHHRAIKMFRAGRYARQHASQFSVVALLANLWRPF
jgi:hypothetical protein